MERTTNPKALNRDGYSKTFSIPRALMALSDSFLSHREALIISKIVSLSSKYIDKGGCNLSNGILAKRHRCSKPTVSNAIAKAKWLGMLESRIDDVKILHNQEGVESYVQSRQIVINIPQIWEFFGEVWGEFFFKGCPASEIMLDWLSEELQVQHNLKQEHLNIKKFLDNFKTSFFTEEGLNRTAIKFSKGGILKIIRPPLENYKTPFGTLYAFYVSGYKFTDISFQKKDSSKDTKFNLEKVLDLFPEEWRTNETFKEALTNFYEHRVEKGNKLTPRAASMMAKKLIQYPYHIACQALNKSVENGWTGVFPESSKTNHPNTTPGKPDKVPPKKQIKQAVPDKETQTWLDIYEAAKAVLSNPNNGQLPDLAANIVRMRQQILDARRPFTGRRDMYYQQFPHWIVERYSDWLQNRDWLKDKKPNLFDTNHKLFREQFLPAYAQDNDDFDPITGQYFEG